MIKTGRQSPNQARSEVRRYITLPGQATGYKIGMLKIMELRAEGASGNSARSSTSRPIDDLLIG